MTKSHDARAHAELFSRLREAAQRVEREAWSPQEPTTTPVPPPPPPAWTPPPASAAPRPQVRPAHVTVGSDTWQDAVEGLREPTM